MKCCVRGLRGKAPISNYTLLYEGMESDGFGYVVEYIDAFTFMISDEFHQQEIKESTERLCSRGGTRKMRRQARLDRLERLGLYKKPDQDLPF